MDRFPMDVLIVGPARSGSTLLANLLTTPPGRVVLIEPGITRGGMLEYVRRDVERYGWSIDAETWHRPDESSQERFERLLRPRLRTVERWGVKEVNPAGLPALIELCPPRHVLLSVRDIRACAISMKEKESLQGPIYREALTPKSDEWLRMRLLEGAAASVRMLVSPPPRSVVTVARYEDIVSSPEHRAVVERALDWPLDGNPAGSLEAQGRAFEIERHGGRVAATSIDRRREESEPTLIEFADSVVRQASEYQRMFGYATA
jgi:hypothetical protein